MATSNKEFRTSGALKIRFPALFYSLSSWAADTLQGVKSLNTAASSALMAGYLVYLHFLPLRLSLF